MTETERNSTPHPRSHEVGLRDSGQLGWCNSETSEIVPGVAVKPGMQVVDVGCGWGGYTHFCGNQGADITFIDRQADHVSAVQKRLEALSGISVRGIVSECDPVPLPDAYADLVICTEVLEHVPDPDALMREIVRIAKPGALCVLTVPDARGENLIKEVAHPDYFKEPNHIRIFTSQDFEALIESHGLKIQSHEYRGAFWAIFYLFKWVTTQPGERLFEDVHPITKLWTRTWHEVLQHPDSASIVRALNEALPKSQVVVARKDTSEPLGQD